MTSYKDDEEDEEIRVDNASKIDRQNDEDSNEYLDESHAHEPRKNSDKNDEFDENEDAYDYPSDDPQMDTLATSSGENQTSNTNNNSSSGNHKSDGELVLLCKICNKLFDNLHRLQRHMLSHDMNPDLRKFKCEFCNKAFKFKHHLKVSDSVSRGTGQISRKFGFS